MIDQTLRLLLSACNLVKLQYYARAESVQVWLYTYNYNLQQDTSMLFSGE